MTTESPQPLQGPKTEFSFYPPDIQAVIAQEEFAGLVVNIKKRSHHTVQIFYELWRTRRDEDLYDLIGHEFVRNIVARAIFNTDESVTPNEFTTVTASAHTRHNVPIESCKEFLITVVENAMKVDFQVPFKDSLDPKYQRIAEINAEWMTERIELKKQIHVGADQRNN